MASRASQIPVGTQFSPQLIDLGEFIKAILTHSGDKPAMVRAIWAPPVNIRDTPVLPTSIRTQSLPLEAAIQYGLLDSDYEATDLTRRLATLSGQDLNDEFARHILFELGGLRVVEAAQQMALDGLKVTADGLAGYLTDQGFRVTVHNGAINSLRMWLARAGVFPKSRGNAWEVDAAAKQRLVGLDDQDIAALVSLSKDQRAFAIALARIDPQGPHSAASVRDLAETIVGHRLDRGNLPNTFLKPLKSAGLIKYRTKGTQGGKASVLETTPKFKKEVLQPFLERTVRTLDANLTAYYKKNLSEVYAELDADEAHIKGAALEAYAVHIMRLLGLRFVAWRKRAKDETGQAEIDVVLAGVLGGVATRWQVQCKNKPSGVIRLEDVAKEIGLVPLTKATHIMVVGNCRATADAKSYALEIMRNTTLSVIIVEKDDFERIREDPGAIASILRAKALESASLDRHGLAWIDRT